MDIHQFIRAPHRFRWGGAGLRADDRTRGDDCMTFAATWCFETTGIDPAKNLRGTYRDRESAHAVMQSFGGPLSFMSAHLEPLGAKRVQAPADGDIGLCEMLAGETTESVTLTLVGAVCFGPIWASISPVGVSIRPAKPVAVWRLPA
ncbi:MAG TPA: hypothetical protein DDW73_14770 [Rhizobium sp.]|jgi:hypothetical protein|nr:hypothetical protein [Rhizobium sp.]